MEHLIFLILAASSLLSAGKSSTSDLLVIIASVVFVGILSFIKSNQSNFTRLDKCLIPLVLTYLLFTGFSVVTSISFHTSYRIWTFSGIVLLFAYSSSIYLSTSKAIQGLTSKLILFAGMISLTTFVFYMSGFKVPQGDTNLFFPVYGHNRFAEFYLPLLPFSLFLLFDKTSSRLVKVAIILSLNNFIISFSRSSYLAVILVSLFILATKIIKDKRVRRVSILLMIGSLTICTVLLPVWISSKGFNPKSAPLLYIFNKPFTVTDRINFFKDAIKKWQTSPINGLGQGTYTYTAVNRWVDTQSTSHVHNHPIQTLYESGILGLGAEIALLTFLVTIILRPIRSSPNKLIFLGVTMSFIQAQFDFGWEIPIVFLINLILLFSLFQVSKASDQTIPIRQHVLLKITLFVSIVIFALLSLVEILPTGTKLDNVTFPSAGADNMYERLKKADEAMFIQDSVNISAFAPVINILSSNSGSLDIKKRYDLVERISRRYAPHDFFWVAPDSLRASVLKMVSDLRSDKDLSTLPTNQVAQINYWLYTKMLINGERLYDDYQHYLDTAVKLDPNNQKYSTVSEINKDLGSADANSLVVDVDLLNNQLKVTEKPTIYLALLDHVYMKVADLKMAVGEYDQEIEYRIMATNGTKSPTAYISLAKRLKKLGRNDESQIYLKQCVDSYPQCGVWYQAEK